MPDYSNKLNIPLPIGTEQTNRQSYRQVLEAIEKNAALDPFILESAVYDSDNDKVVVTLGKGTASFLGTLVNLAADSIINIETPVSETNYYIYLKNDGTFIQNETAEDVTGAVLLYEISTGATVDEITTEDLRGQLPGAAAKAVHDVVKMHEADLMPHGVFDYTPKLIRVDGKLSKVEYYISEVLRAEKVFNRNPNGSLKSLPILLTE